MSGTIIYAAGAGVVYGLASAGSDRSLVKAAATSRTSTTSMTLDPTLQFAVAAGRTYLIDGSLRFFANASGGWQFALAAPALSVGAISAVDGIAGNSASLPVGGDADATPFGVALQSVLGNLCDYAFRAVVTAGAAGVVGVTWAQSASNAAATKLVASSFLRVRQVS